MKAIVVYYSWSGNTEVAAGVLASAVKAKKLELKETKKRKLPWVYVVGGFQAITGARSKLTQENFNLKGIDTVFVCSPIWASSPVPAVNTFLAKADLKGKKVLGLFILGDDKPPKKAFKNLEAKVLKKDGIFGGATFLQSPEKEKLPAAAVKTLVSGWLKKINKKK